ncbi:MAG TPA: nitroreductase [Actinomycetota bacterium]|nr:nitroreductase [Actinomycetota bacterium]
MDAIEAIMTRRSVPRCDGDVGRDAIETILAAAVRAPNHHLTQPWRFVVLAGEARTELARAWAAGLEREGKDASRIPEKVLRSPVIVCVLERPHLDNPKVVEIDEHYAVGAAIQNMLLAAHALGLGAMHRTGAATTMPEVRDYLGAADGELIAGFVYVGRPPEGDDSRPRSRRTDHSEITEWRG